VRILPFNVNAVFLSLFSTGLTMPHICFSEVYFTLQRRCGGPSLMGESRVCATLPNPIVLFLTAEVATDFQFSPN